MDEEKQEKAEVKRLPVIVLGMKGKSALVEWVAEGKVQRGYIPTTTLKEDGVSSVTLGRAIPYGVRWEKIELSATPEKVADALRKAGIWTKEDLTQRPNVALGVLQATYRVDLTALIRLEE